jgi:hypothetical protein
VPRDQARKGSHNSHHYIRILKKRGFFVVTINYAILNHEDRKSNDPIFHPERLHNKEKTRNSMA